MSILRAIEKTIRRTALNLLGGSGAQGPDAPLPDAFPERPAILLVRIDRIGDALVSAPVLRALRRRFPEGRIDMLLGERNRTVAPLLPFVDTAHVLPGKFLRVPGMIRRLRRNRYDAVVNLHLNRSASAMLVGRLVRGGVTIEDMRENAFAGPAGSLEHVVTMTSRLLRPFGIEPITGSDERKNPLIVRLPPESIETAERLTTELITVSDAGGTVLINVSAAGASRNWPAEHFIAVAARLREEGNLPIICGAPHDAERVKEIAAAAGAVPLPPLTGYADFAAVTARVDVVLTSDTSTVHLAAATGRPTVALYASEQMERAWSPWGVPRRTLLGPDGIASIEPHDVVTAVRQLLQSGATGPEHQSERTEFSTRSV